MQGIYANIFNLKQTSLQFEILFSNFKNEVIRPGHQNNINGK